MRGFTLLEVLVVTAITVMIAGFLVANFSRSRVQLNQVAVMVQDAVREAQAQALSGSLIRGTYRCGYGVHFDATGYLLYAGPDSASVDCATQDRNYDAASDAIVRQALLPNNALEIVMPAPDIFFEPPDPTTFVGGVSTPGQSASLVIRQKGAPCPSIDCRTIYVTTSGRIQLQ